MGPAYPLSARMGIFLYTGCLFKIPANSNPFISGIRMSKRMTLGESYASWFSCFPATIRKNCVLAQKGENLSQKHAEVTKILDNEHFP